MFVWDQGVIKPSDVDTSDALEELFLRLAPGMSQYFSNTVGNHLDAGNTRAAAEAIAEHAVRRELTLSAAQRQVLREALTANRGDLTNIDRLDKQTETGGATRLLPVAHRQPPATVPMRSAAGREPSAETLRMSPMRSHTADFRQADPNAPTAMIPAIRPDYTGAHRR
ncbi:hypothetical protein [Saccharopolyspora shandongensis]|uniref:hypothetical protein n=1 Tax=Saccharopolyspora shandongensis TaxID=418495 RepID=UPI0033D48DC0